MAVTTIHHRYPVQVEAQLDRPLSRWLWLVKWLLAFPHYIVLAFLWAAFVVLTVVAFVAILFTGRYPRAVFDFNVGVLRWSWRVAYYTWGALATDRYPPFTLSDVPDYPARLDVDYPARLSRGLVLVKSWLLALPHYVIAAFFVGGGTWLATGRTREWQWGWGTGGLVGVLVTVCAVVLLFTGRYPQPLFDFILGMNRWVLRVWAYAALMTDEYPPFRLDLGGHEPEGVLAIASAAPPPGAAALPERPAGAPASPPPSGATPAGVAPSGWTGGGIAAVAVGGVLALSATGLLIGGAGAGWVHLTQRDAAGYLTSPSVILDSGGYAVRTRSIRFAPTDPAWVRPDSVLGTVRIRATGTDPTRPLFVGIAPSAAATGYLSGVDHSTLTGITGSRPSYDVRPGTAPATPPPVAGIWTAQASGVGSVELTWTAASGSWSVVVANADGSAGVRAGTDVGATVPWLGWVALGSFVLGVILLAAGALLVAIPVARVSQRRAVVAATEPGAGGPRRGDQGPGDQGPGAQPPGWRPPSPV